MTLEMKPLICLQGDTYLTFEAQRQTQMQTAVHASVKAYGYQLVGNSSLCSPEQGAWIPTMAQGCLYTQENESWVLLQLKEDNTTVVQDGYQKDMTELLTVEITLMLFTNKLALASFVTNNFLFEEFVY
ncbi:hypothetical protein ARMGADRAFT_1032183 [Armillaria gallica]|uniref:Uncharacterized protein n=1 Tax=Armillaria gallica TaxID=47427 RepID=A0A2H3D5U0_ARMGA|nr:hypothetical protein ARMGADRAFT_1032183 [Armillaria gallica]